jgi:hypothetical protein
MSLFAELKRRNVFRVGVAYAVGAWLLLQLTEVLSELLSLPTEIGPIVVAIVAIGFPIALFFAWAYEMTPQGIKREKDVDRNQSITQQTGRKLDRAIIALLAVALAYFVYESRFMDRGRGAETAGVAPATAPSEADGPTASPAAEAEAMSVAVDEDAIAVLPFANRSLKEEDLFFTDGIHDDLLTQLAKIRDLKVISRTSVMEYRDTTKKIPEIATELGVGKCRKNSGRWCSARRQPGAHQCPAHRRKHRPAPVGRDLRPRDDHRQHFRHSIGNHPPDRYGGEGRAVGRRSTVAGWAPNRQPGGLGSLAAR